MLPYDFYCPSTRKNLAKIVCSLCGVYEATQEAFRKHHMCLASTNRHEMPAEVCDTVTGLPSTEAQQPVSVTLAAAPSKPATSTTGVILLEDDEEQDRIPIISDVSKWTKTSYVDTTEAVSVYKKVLELDRLIDGQYYDTVSLLGKDMAPFAVPGQYLSTHVIEFFLACAERKFSETFTGFEFPAVLCGCRAGSREVERIRDGIQRGKTSVQIFFTGSGPFVTSFRQKGFDRVVLFNSFSSKPTELLKSSSISSTAA